MAKYRVRQFEEVEVEDLNSDSKLEVNTDTDSVLELSDQDCDQESDDLEHSKGHDLEHPEW